MYMCAVHAHVSVCLCGWVGGDSDFYASVALLGFDLKQIHLRKSLLGM